MKNAVFDQLRYRGFLDLCFAGCWGESIGFCTLMHTVDVGTFTHVKKTLTFNLLLNSRVMYLFFLLTLKENIK